MAVSKTEPLLILGGGLMGLSIAHELAQKGYDVEILSRRRSEAAGFVAAGMLAPHAEGLTNQLLQLGQLSLRRQSEWVKQIENTSGMNCGLRQCGIVVPFTNHKERDTYPTAKFGQALNEIELNKELPGIGATWKAGSLFHQDGQIDNRRLLMRALEKACFELGVKFQEGVEVLDLLHEKSKFRGVKIRNNSGELEKIQTSAGVLCSGAWSNHLINELPVFPVKGQMLSIQGPRNAIKRVIFGPGTYLVPREDGLIIVGATSESNAGFKEGLTPFGQMQLQNGLNSLLPAAHHWPHMERWWGFRPCTPDEGPIIGESFLKGLLLATGHHRNGVLLASITADLISKLISENPLSKKESELLSTFKWDRF